MASDIAITLPAARPQTEVSARTQLSATHRAQVLALVLDSKHNIAADVHQLTPGRALVSVCRGLLIYVDAENFWWNSPDRSQSGGLLLTYAAYPASAAARIAQHYTLLRDYPVDELLISPLPLLADVLASRHVCPI
ncbi:hypothetical protein ACFV0L_18415 [Streptosporangium canum]|uniref:hypothetical protein n=1 Tax=Streptosporangium canum TaxID=324952 RepID=UPI0036AB1363